MLDQGELRMNHSREKPLVYIFLKNVLVKTGSFISQQSDELSMFLHKNLK